MRHDTRKYLASLDAETLITVIEGLCGFGGFDVNHGPDPCDGKPIVYGSHHLHGTFTLANVDTRIEENPMSKEYFVKIGCANRSTLNGILCDLIEVGDKGIQSFFILTEDGKPLNHLHTDPHLSVERDQCLRTARFVCNNLCKPIDGCGCMQDPPCRGCSSDDAKYRLSLHLYFVRAVFESGGEAEYFITACHEEDAIHRVYLKNVRDHEERAEFFATKIADEDSADPS